MAASTRRSNQHSSTKEPEAAVRRTWITAGAESECEVKTLLLINYQNTPCYGRSLSRVLS